MLTSLTFNTLEEFNKALESLTESKIQLLEVNKSERQIIFSWNDLAELERINHSIVGI